MKKQKEMKKRVLAFMVAMALVFATIGGPEVTMASLVDYYDSDEIIQVTNATTFETAYVIETDYYLLECDITKDKPVYFYIDPTIENFPANEMKITIEANNENPVHLEVFDGAGNPIDFQKDFNKGETAWISYSIVRPEQRNALFFMIVPQTDEEVHVYLEAWNYGYSKPPVTRLLASELKEDGLVNISLVKPDKDGMIYLDGKKDYSIGLSNTSYEYTILVNGKTWTLGEFENLLTKEGRYEVELENKYGKDSYTICYDMTAPSITGVKNNKTYKKAVTIKFSDKNSGIKSAKLNGKNVKSGKKITKPGKYTLVVTDQCGSSKTVKFTIKKK